MKFSFDRDAMIKEIAIAQDIISNKNPISVLSNLLLIAQDNTLTIKATDTTVNYMTQLPVDIAEEGSTTIFYEKFMNILSSSPAGINSIFSISRLKRSPNKKALSSDVFGRITINSSSP